MRKKRQFKAGRRYHQGSRVAHRAFTFDGAKTYTYDYHVDGQLARADYGNGKAEDLDLKGSDPGEYVGVNMSLRVRSLCDTLRAR